MADSAEINVNADTLQNVYIHPELAFVIQVIADHFINYIPFLAILNYLASSHLVL